MAERDGVQSDSRGDSDLGGRALTIGLFRAGVIGVIAPPDRLRSGALNMRTHIQRRRPSNSRWPGAAAGSFAGIYAFLRYAARSGARPAARRYDVGGAARIGVDGLVVMITSTGTAGSVFSWTWTLNFCWRNWIVWLSWASAPL